MSKIGEKIYDLTPAWLCRLARWIKERPRYIRWWFIRAQGKLPACDCWEFNDTLAKTIIQGLDYLLNAAQIGNVNPINNKRKICFILKV